MVYYLTIIIFKYVFSVHSHNTIRSKVLILLDKGKDTKQKNSTNFFVDCKKVNFKKKFMKIIFYKFCLKINQF